MGRRGQGIRRDGEVTMSEAKYGQTRLTVNGSEVAIDADPASPLLFALRNRLGLSSVHLGCGANQCGSCHVMVDGHAVAASRIRLVACGTIICDTSSRDGDDLFGGMRPGAGMTDQVGATWGETGAP